MTEDNGKSKCFGFVCFSTVDEASRALSEMNNTNVNGQYIYVALAQPKALRRAQIERERMSRFTMNMGTMNMGMGMGSPYSAVGPPGMIPPMWSQQMGTGPPSMRGMGGRGRMSNGGAGSRGRGFRGSPGGRGNGSPGRGRWQPGRGMGPFGRGRMGGPFDPTMDGMRSNMGGMVSNPAAALASAPPDQQKIMLGEQLYPLVHSLNSEKAAKITGMLLEMDNNEVLYLIENTEALQAKVEEAMTVLKEHDIN